MIPRYSRAEMSAIWSEENKWSKILEIELLACEAREARNEIPFGTTETIKKRAVINIARINEIETEVKHDLIAFVTSIAEVVGEEARYLHFGLTSSDVIDTCFNLQMRDSCVLLDGGIRNLLSELNAKATEYKNVLCVGRTHGMHSEHMTLGLKFARMYSEFKRALRRLTYVKNEEISVCAISGAVGTYGVCDPYVEKYIADKLSMAIEPVSSQIIPRDRHAMFFSVLAVIAGSIENTSLEIRNLHRTEVGEVEEPFSAMQKGSSAMPHKKNPILSENLTGIARLIRSYVVPALENISLWHERDISHSSVERVITPDACILLDFAINRLTYLLRNMTINCAQVAKNLNMSSEKLYSQKLLLALVESGMSREEAYRLTQRHSFDARGLIKSANSDTDIVRAIGAQKLSEIFCDIKPPVHMDLIFARVFGQEA